MSKITVADGSALIRPSRIMGDDKTMLRGVAAFTRGDLDGLSKQGRK